MAKKSFKDSNPAMQFISVPESETVSGSRPVAQVKQDLTAETGRKGEKAPDCKSENPPEQSAKFHKSDVGMSRSAVQVPGSGAAKGCDSPPEKKSRRLNLLLQPSVLDELAKIAHMRRTSLNDLINSVLKEYNAAHAETIGRYDEFFGKGA